MIIRVQREQLRRDFESRKHAMVMDATFQGRWSFQGTLMIRRQALQAGEDCITLPKPVQKFYWTKLSNCSLLKKKKLPGS